MERTAVIILGATGDLSQKKLIPALDMLRKHQNLDENAIVVGSGRKPLNQEEFAGLFLPGLALKKQIFYHQGIEGMFGFIKSKGDFNKIIIFFALPPDIYIQAAQALHKDGFGEETILIVEKPFGRDLESAKLLNQGLRSYFDESQIFRNDHYLAKEAVQNILVFRFANFIFEPVWNNRYVESIQINAFESIGVGKRSAYYDKAGAIRDMIQNHLMQLLCLITMEPPVNLSAEEIRNQKLNVLKSIDVKQSCRAQYYGYRQEPGIPADSNTETYAEMQLFINNYRWSGVPVYIRTGKALNRTGTEIALKFKSLPGILYNRNKDIESNSIIFRIQPSEGIVVNLANKVPGSGISISDTQLSFCYRDAFDQRIQDAYQKLLADALVCDRTLFPSSRECELAWELLVPFLDQGPLSSYEKGATPKSCYSNIWLPFEKYQGFC